uniref:Fibrinogen C-terminal domain-containing protein n=1 Tax=Leptobrachium leishanense TaxID=445787 RepID=A0A8C5QDJ1_9ANUR
MKLLPILPHSVVTRPHNESWCKYRPRRLLSPFIPGCDGSFTSCDHFNVRKHHNAPVFSAVPGKFQLRVDLEDFDGFRAYATYSDFKLEGEDQKYTLRFGSFTGGTAGDSLSVHKDQAFTTKDRDNDVSTDNCAEFYKGGWWFHNCLHSNLNGEYLKGKHNQFPPGRGVVWHVFKKIPYSLKVSEMKIRPQI